MRAHTSASGPKVALLRQDVHVEVFVQASVLDVVYRPVSIEPLIPFVQRPALDSGFSLGRLKLSTVGSGSTGTTSALGVALDWLESGLSPSALRADTL